MSSWQDVIVLSDNEYVVASWKSALSKNGNTIKNKQNKSMRMLKLVLTNHRLEYFGKDKIFGGTYEFLLDIPLESIKVLTTSGRLVKSAKIKTDDDEFHTSPLEPEDKKIPKNEYGEYFREKVLEQIKERKRELDAKKMSLLIDFSFLKAFIEKGGLVLTTFRCPNCNAPIELPKGGAETKCNHCNSVVYAQDVFEKVKKMLS
ncbi:MAG: hypothetical protein ACOWW1_07425 [archaeon]